MVRPRARGAAVLRHVQGTRGDRAGVAGRAAHAGGDLALTRGREELADLYRRYNACCNAHELERLGEFVAPDVLIDGERRRREDYAANLRGWIEAFPDVRWELRHLLVDGDLIAGHFLLSGRHWGTFLGVAATGRPVTAREFAVYRIADGRIAEVWGTVDERRILEQLRG